MFSESEHGKIRFDPDWKAIFERDYCNVCKFRDCCQIDWKCDDMKEFIKNMEEE